ncbi:aldo/keto reductase [Alcaligenaceae bacterium]|nr:aldo/keto reductase [Alcaligenaceae bacterium]
MTTQGRSTALEKRQLGNTGLQIAPLVFGCNVFGWTVDETTSFSILDKFIDAGLNAIDTADMYSNWAPGNQGGESETIIGKWFNATPTRREKVVLITKVGAPLGPDRNGLSAKRIITAAEDSLRRLQTDHIDLYLSHYPDDQTPIDETLRAYETLIQQGKVLAIGASNHSPEQLRAALKVAGDTKLPRYDVIQPEYNLYDRACFEEVLRDMVQSEHLGAITYYGLARGFLSGKYRSKDDLHKSVRGSAIEKYLDARGLRILDALATVAQAHRAQLAEVALAWVMTRPGVTAPIASATSLKQLDSLIRATRLILSTDDLDLLEKVSAFN